MSLVGTRPPTLDECEKYELHHRARLGISVCETALQASALLIQKCPHTLVPISTKKSNILVGI